MRQFTATAPLRRSCVAVTLLAAVATMLATSGTATGTQPDQVGAEPGLYLVTLEDNVSQDPVLTAVGAPPPVYRWSAALNGFAVRLTGSQARELTSVPGVEAVERNSVRRLAGAPASLPASAQFGARHRGGAGVVIGVVDSGLDPDSPLFATVPGLGRALHGFRGVCEAGEGWPRNSCSRKVVGARWYVAGFGSDDVRSTSSMSPSDDSGHGTLVASVAAGNSGVSVDVGAQSLGVYAGTAPQARLAVYKACWTAPDPDHDGCATADLVSAIDQATADGVDVLNLSVAGGSLFDTVDRALLGATQHGIFVTGAAGNNGRTAHAAHNAPWVTTVGAVTGPVQGGTLTLGDGEVLSGAMSAHRSIKAPLVIGSEIPAKGSTQASARLCRPGSLDAAKAAGHIVLCARGGIGRVDKSRTVSLADGVGMVLANVRQGGVHADFHKVPSIHLAVDEAQALGRWIRAHPGAEVALRPGADVGGTPRVVHWSASGDPEGNLVKPDLTANGVDVLGAVPPSVESSARWNFLTGTSAATARVSGQAAVVLSRHRTWSPARVRSALMTTARSVEGDPSSLEQGAGRSRAEAALRPGLVYDLDSSDYARYLNGDLRGRDLNLPSIKADGPLVVQRSVTNVGHRALYYSVKARGFERHRVSVTPVALRIGPGETRTYTVTITGPVRRDVDSGWITWRGANGIRVRIPVVIAD